ncbi:MAG: hypothetical protein WCG04_05900 [Alphaproteobacteria bacterium]
MQDTAYQQSVVKEGIFYGGGGEEDYGALVTRFLGRESTKKLFVDLFIPAANLVNDMKYLITRTKPEALLRAEQEEEEKKMRSMMAVGDVAASAIADNDILVGKKIDEKSVTYNFDTGGVAVMYENEGGAVLHRNAGVSAGFAGAVVKYYKLDPEKINTSGPVSADAIRKQISKNNLRYSVLRLKSIEDIKTTEAKLSKPGTILVSLGEPEENGLFVYALSNTYENNNKPVFKMVVKPSGKNTIKDSFGFHEPEKTTYIVQSISEYLQSFGEGGMVDVGPKQKWLITILDKTSDVYKAFVDAEIIEEAQLGGVARNHFKTIKIPYSSKGDVYLKAYKSYDDSKETQNPVCVKLPKNASTAVALKDLLDWQKDGYFHVIDSYVFYIKTRGGRPEIKQLNNYGLVQSQEIVEKLAALNDQVLKALKQG